jgi:hypothetical protein
MRLNRFDAYDLAHAIRGAALGRVPNVPARGTCGGEDVWRLVAAWRQHEHADHRSTQEIREAVREGMDLFMVLTESVSWQQRCRCLPAPTHPPEESDR